MLWLSPCAVLFLMFSCVCLDLRRVYCSHAKNAVNVLRRRTRYGRPRGLRFPCSRALHGVARDELQLVPDKQRNARRRPVAAKLARPANHLEPVLTQRTLKNLHEHVDVGAAVLHQTLPLPLLRPTTPASGSQTPRAGAEHKLRCWFSVTIKLTAGDNPQICVWIDSDPPDTCSS